LESTVSETIARQSRNPPLLRSFFKYSKLKI